MLAGFPGSKSAVTVPWRADRLCRDGAKRAGGGSLVVALVLSGAVFGEGVAQQAEGIEHLDQPAALTRARITADPQLAGAADPVAEQPRFPGRFLAAARTVDRFGRAHYW